GMAVAQHTVGRNQLHVAHFNDIVFAEVIDHHRFPVVVFPSVHGQRKVCGKVAVECQAFVGFALKPAANQQEEYQPGKRVEVSWSGCRDDVVTAAEEQCEQAYGNGDIDVDLFLGKAVEG